MWSNDVKCEYMLMFYPNNLARKGLMKSCSGCSNKGADLTCFFNSVELCVGQGCCFGWNLTISKIKSTEDYLENTTFDIWTTYIYCV